VTCIREGDEVTLKACKCKTGSVSLVDLRFRSVLLLTAFRGCLFQSCQPLQTTVAVGGDRRLGEGGDCKGPAPLLHSPRPPSPPFLPPPQQQLQSTCMHAALCTYKCLTYTPLLPKQNSKHPKVHACRSRLHAIPPSVCHASVYQHSGLLSCISLSQSNMHAAALDCCYLTIASGRSQATWWMTRCL